MSSVRTHFCTLVARGKGAGSRPVRYGMNGTIPATVNSSEGSGDTSEALGTTVWPRSAKCSRKRRRISAVCMRLYFDSFVLWTGGRWRRGPTPRRRTGRGGAGRGAPPQAVAGGRAPGSGQGEPLAGRQCERPARRDRGAEAGRGTQLGLPLSGGDADVGAEVPDRRCEVAQAVGRGAENAGGREPLGHGGDLADGERAHGGPHRQPEQPAHHAARRVVRRASRPRRPAAARARLSCRVRAAVRTP